MSFSWKLAYWTFDWRVAPIDVRRAADGIGVWAWFRGKMDLKVHFNIPILIKLNNYGRDWTGGSRVELILGRLVWRWTVLIKIICIFHWKQIRISYFAWWYAAGDGCLEQKNQIPISIRIKTNYGATTRRIWCCCWDEGIGGRRPLGAGGRRPLKHRMILDIINRKKWQTSNELLMVDEA